MSSISTSRRPWTRCLMVARLLKKVEAHGVGGKVLEWLEEWLKNRKQRVVVNGVSSDW